MGLLPGFALVVEYLVSGRAVVTFGLVVFFMLLVVVIRLVCGSIGAEMTSWIQFRTLLTLT